MAVRRETVIVDADVNPFVRKMGTASAAARGFAENLDNADSRMANLVQSGLALAPALTPIGAAAIPAVAGLTTQLGFAVGAAGAAIIAFHAVGDAIKAVDDYQLKPTAENFAKVEQSLDALGPAGQEFALAMRDLEPRLRQIKAVTEQGFLPGVSDSIDEILKVQPELQRVLGEIADSAGDSLREAGDNLNDPRWQRFFGYLETTARPTLSKMGRTFGNFTEGIANMIMAFDPLSRDFADGFLRMSRSFNDWAAGLEGDQGFANFVDYIRTSGPEVRATLGALVTALIDLLKASAPVGQVVLPIIQALAEGLSAVADSPAGPIILATAAAVGTLGRSLALLRAVGLRSGEGGQVGIIGQSLGVDKIKGILPAMREVTAATDALRIAEEKQAAARLDADLANRNARGVGADRGTQAWSNAQRQMLGLPLTDKDAFAKQKTAVAAYTSAQGEVEKATKRVTDAERARQTAFRQGLGSFGRTAGVVGGLALASSGLADDTGLANTMSLALMGTIAGPWGAAIGGGIGVVMDLAAANNELEGAVKNLKLAMEDQWNFTGQNAALKTAKTELDKYQDSVNRANNPLDAPDSIGQALKDQWTAVSDFFTNASEEQEAAVDSAEKASDRLKANARALVVSFTGDNRFKNTPFKQMAEQLDTVQTALQRRGLKLKDYDPGNPYQWALYNDAIRDYVKVTDSVPGKSRAVGRALRDMQDDMIPTATAAEQLKSAMDALFGVKLDVAGATTAWEQGLRDLRKQLEETGDLAGTGKNALLDQSLFQGQVQRLFDKFSAEAADNASGKKLTDTLVQGRDAIIETGKAAGLSEEQVDDYLKTLGLTPKNLVTLIQTSGTLTAREEIEAIQRLYGLTPKDMTTLMRADASGAEATVERLRKKYDLTPREIRTILKAVDQATGPLAHVLRILGKIPAVTHTTIRVNTVHSGGGYADPLGIKSADGNIIDRIGSQQPQIRPYSGPRGLTWSEEGSGPWEAFISGHPAKIDRSRAIATEVVNRLGGHVAFADGGIRDSFRYRTPAAATVVVSGPFEVSGALRIPGIGSGHFEGEMRRVARDEIRSDAKYGGARNRQGRRP